MFFFSFIKIEATLAIKRPPWPSGVMCMPYNITALIFFKETKAAK